MPIRLCGKSRKKWGSQKKSVKKVAGAVPGFVIYHTNYSLMAVPECKLQEVK